MLRLIGNDLPEYVSSEVGRFVAKYKEELGEDFLFDPRICLTRGNDYIVALESFGRVGAKVNVGDVSGIELSDLRSGLSHAVANLPFLLRGASERAYAIQPFAYQRDKSGFDLSEAPEGADDLFLYVKYKGSPLEGRVDVCFGGEQASGINFLELRDTGRILGEAVGVLYHELCESSNSVFSEGSLLSEAWKEWNNVLRNMHPLLIAADKFGDKYDMSSQGNWIKSRSFERVPKITRVY